MAARYVERAAGAGGAIGFSGIEPREAGDRKGEEAKAMTLATELGRARDQGIASAAVVIGGPDGSETAFWLPLRSRSPL